jgi:hypothetical protein
MRWVQALAAVCWIVYGVLLHAVPVIAANVIVAGLAAFSAWRVASPQSPRNDAVRIAAHLENSSPGS